MIRGSQGYLKSSGKGKESWGKSLFEFNRGLFPDSTRTTYKRDLPRAQGKNTTLKCGVLALLAFLLSFRVKLTIHLVFQTVFFSWNQTFTEITWRGGYQVAGQNF